MSTVLAIAWLAALCGSGVAILSRMAPWLGRLERVAYGAPLGMVTGSLVVLAVAWRTGLTLPLVVGVGAVALLSAAVLRPRTPAAELRLATIRPAPGAMRGALTAALVIGVLAVRWAFFWAGAWTIDDQGLWASHTYLWGDWSLHLGDSTGFAYGDNFPPVHPRFAGLPHTYHYLTSITAAAMIRLGMTPIAALTFQSFVLLLFIAIGLLAFARRMAGRWSDAALAVVLFLVGGGLGWWWTVAEALTRHDLLGTLGAHPWDRGIQEAHNFRWLNVYYAYLVPQRSTLYGFPLGMLVLTCLRHAVDQRRAIPYLLAGVIAGLLPFANLGALLSLALITPFIALLFPAVGWIGFFFTCGAVAAPQLLAQQGGAPGALHALRLQVGWIAGRDPWWWFWLKNLGVFVPLLVAALASRTLLRPRDRRFLWAFMPVFALANLAVFQPWDWDNTKVLLWWYLGSCVLVAAWIARAWREHRGALVRATLGAVLASLVFSGLLVDLHQGLQLDRHLFVTRDELELARRVRDETPPRSLFVVALQNNHPVPTLAGRRVLMSYPGWLWSQGVAYAEREREVRKILGLAPGADSLMRHYHVDFVAIGPEERASFGADPLAWRARFPHPIETATYEVFDVRGLGP
jgi:hypothetical protein